MLTSMCAVFSFPPQARQQAQMRQQMATDSKNDYSSSLQKFNQEQNEHYFTIIPNIFQVKEPSKGFVSKFFTAAQIYLGSRSHFLCMFLVCHEK